MRHNGGLIVLALLLVGLGWFFVRKKSVSAQSLFDQAQQIRNKLGKPAQINIGNYTIGGNNPALIDVPASELPPAFSPGFSQGPSGGYT